MDSEGPDPIDTLDVERAGIGDLARPVTVERANLVDPIDMRLRCAGEGQDQTAFLGGEIVAFLAITGAIFDAGHVVGRDVLVLERIGEQRFH